MTGLVLLAGLALSAGASGDGVTRHALVVGHNGDGGTRSILRYAGADAEVFDAVLLELGGVVAEDRILLLQPDAEDLRATFDELRQNIAASEGRTEVVFYYSGHSDEEGLLLGPDRLSYMELRSQLDSLPADVRLAVLDSCASGSMIRAKGGQTRPPFMVDEAVQVEGFAYITSNSEDEASQEAERLQGSFFTHYLTTGLRGAADTSGDGRVTLHEAYQFAFDETLAHTERTRYGPQHAAYDFQLSGTGDLVLTDFGRSAATLVMAEDVVGRASVRGENGRLVAELGKREGAAVELALPVGTYELTVTEPGRYGTATLNLVSGEAAVLEADALVWREGEATTARGGAVEEEPEEPSLLDSFEVGFQPTLAISLLDEERRGVIVGLGGSVAKEGMRGGQFALGYNEASPFDGVQFALGGNIGREETRGAQLSVGFNLAQGEMQGAQTSVFFNTAQGEGWLFQLSSVNHLAGDFDGAQFGGVNIAEGLRGTQIGLINIGGQVHGSQIGFVNIASRVRGMQLGVLNIAGVVEGAPIGALSVSRNGRFNLSAFLSESDPINADLKIGGPQGLYTLFGAGGSPNEQLYGTIGLGGHVRASRIFLDFDAALAVYTPAERAFQQPPDLMLRGRAIVGGHAFERLAPFAGVTFTYAMPNDHSSGLVVHPAWADRKGKVVRAWPGFVAGLQF
jgi:hypothetical protein